MSCISVCHETCIGIRDDSESNTRSFLSPVNIYNTNILLNDICHSTAVLDMCCNRAVEKAVAKITTANGNGSRPPSRDDRGTLWGGLTFSRSAEPKPGSGPRCTLRSLTCRDSSCRMCCPWGFVDLGGNVELWEASGFVVHFVVHSEVFDGSRREWCWAVVCVLAVVIK